MLCLFDFDLVYWSGFCGCLLDFACLDGFVCLMWVLLIRVVWIYFDDCGFNVCAFWGCL